MAKEICLYSPIYDFVAEDFINKMEENKSVDVVIRGNTSGGSVFAGWGMVAKIKEHEGHVKMKVDGHVASMGTIILVFVDDTEALEVSRIHLHRADGYVNSPEDQQFLDEINRDLKAKLLKRIDAKKFKELKGLTVEQLFSPEKMIDVWLTAREAKEIGLIKKIVKLNPAEIAAMNRLQIAASLDNPKPNPSNNPKPVKTMTLEELKAQHPGLYNQVLAEGKTAGITEERDRIRGWQAFSHIDPVAVDNGIKGGKVISAADMAEFTAATLKPDYLQKLAAGAAAPVATTATTETPAPKTEQQKEVDQLEKQIDAELKKGNNNIMVK